MVSLRAYARVPFGTGRVRGSMARGGDIPPSPHSYSFHTANHFASGHRFAFNYFIELRPRPDSLLPGEAYTLTHGLLGAPSFRPEPAQE